MSTPNTNQNDLPQSMRALVTRRIGPEPVMEIAKVLVPQWQPGYSLIQVEAAPSSAATATRWGPL